MLLTHDADAHVPLVERELVRRSTRYLRLNTNQFSSAFHTEFRVRNRQPSTVLSVDGRLLEGHDVRSIWNRRIVSPVPTPSIVDPDARKYVVRELEAQLLGCLRSLRCCWLSSPDAIRAASYKIDQLSRAAVLGFSVPRTLVSASPQAIRDFAEECDGSVIAKLVSPGPPGPPEVDVAFMIFTSSLSPQDLHDDAALSSAPVIYQQYVPKDFELRVTIVGESVFACAIHSQANEQTRVDWRRYDFPRTPHRPYELEDDIAELCLRLMRQFDLRFAAFDFVRTPEGETVFLEMNPNGQWAWIEEITGLPIAAAIARELDEPD